MRIPEPRPRPASTRTRGVVVRRAPGPLAGIAGLALLASCSAGGPVAITEPDVSAADRAACTRFLAEVPDTLARQEKRSVTPSDALGAAWGDPAITVTCGVSVPDSFDEFSPCEEANGVGWYVPLEESADQSSDLTFTAVGYRPIVEVVLPATYRPEGAAAVIAQLAAPVDEQLTLVKPCT